MVLSALFHMHDWLMLLQLTRQTDYSIPPTQRARQFCCLELLAMDGFLRRMAVFFVCDGKIELKIIQYKADLQKIQDTAHNTLQELHNVIKNVRSKCCS